MKVYNTAKSELLGDFDIWCGTDLRRANLRGADLSRANLRRANLRGANLCGADLRGADLRETNLAFANLRGANLCGADLRGANLYGAGLRRANLTNSYCYGADLFKADLSGANLRGANLTNSHFDEADLNGATLPEFQIPQNEELVVFKQLREDLICTLRIPAGAKRTAALTSKKCRAERAIVVEIFDTYSHSKVTYGFSLYSPSFFYEVGKEVTPRAPFNDDVRVDCAPGIHFFMTREEAIGYEY